MVRLAGQGLVQGSGQALYNLLSLFPLLLHEAKTSKACMGSWPLHRHLLLRGHKDLGQVTNGG